MQISKKLNEVQLVELANLLYPNESWKPLEIDADGAMYFEISSQPCIENEFAGFEYLPQINSINIYDYEWYKFDFTDSQIKTINNFLETI